MFVVSWEQRLRMVWHQHASCTWCRCIWFNGAAFLPLLVGCISWCEWKWSHNILVSNPWSGKSYQRLPSLHACRCYSNICLPIGSLFNWVSSSCLRHIQHLVRLHHNVTAVLLITKVFTRVLWIVLFCRMLYLQCLNIPLLLTKVERDACYLHATNLLTWFWQRTDKLYRRYSSLCRGLMWLDTWSKQPFSVFAGQRWHCSIQWP